MYTFFFFKKKKTLLARQVRGKFASFHDARVQVLRVGSSVAGILGTEWSESKVGVRVGMLVAAAERIGEQGDQRAFKNGASICLEGTMIQGCGELFPKHR